MQEIHDPGITQMVDVITSNQKGETLFSTAVPKEGEGICYTTLAKGALDHRVNVLCINRDCDSHTTFCELTSREGDTIIYLAPSRKSWSELSSLI